MDVQSVTISWTLAVIALGVAQATGALIVTRRPDELDPLITYVGVVGRLNRRIFFIGPLGFLPALAFTVWYSVLNPTPEWISVAVLSLLYPVAAAVLYQRVLDTLIKVKVQSLRDW